MIAWLKGVILEKKPPEVVVNVNGVGYLVAASMNTFFQLPAEGSEVTLHIHSVIREDAHLLYGFLSQQERMLFCQLIKVNGVGPKLALGILSGVSAEEFVLCIQSQDIASLVKLPGIGKKTAERLVVEMQDKLNGLSDMANEGGQASPESSAMPSQASDDAISALVALGYKSNEASRVIKRLNAEGKSSERLIRDALQSL